MKNTWTPFLLAFLLLFSACSPKYQDVILSKLGSYQTQEGIKHTYLNPFVIRSIILQQPLISFSGDYQGGNPFKAQSYARTDRALQPRTSPGDAATLDSLDIQRMLLSVAGFRSLKLESDTEQAFFNLIANEIGTDTSYTPLAFLPQAMGRTHCYIKVQGHKLMEFVILSNENSKTTVLTLLGGDIRIDDLQRDKDKLLFVQMTNLLLRRAK